MVDKISGIKMREDSGSFDPGLGVARGLLAIILLPLPIHIHPYTRARMPFLLIHLRKTPGWGLFFTSYGSPAAVHFQLTPLLVTPRKNTGEWRSIDRVTDLYLPSKPLCCCIPRSLRTCDLLAFRSSIFDFRASIPPPWQDGNACTKTLLRRILGGAYTDRDESVHGSLSTRRSALAFVRAGISRQGIASSEH